MKNKPINPTIQAQIKLIFSLFLLLYSPINKAQEIQKTPFYLPIHSSQLNDSIVKLNDQLLETGFDLEIKVSTSRLHTLPLGLSNSIILPLY